MLGILAARHLHIPPGSIPVCEEVGNTSLIAPVCFADGVFNNKGLAANVVAGPRENER
jgi:hypothetical protein